MKPSLSFLLFLILIGCRPQAEKEIPKRPSPRFSFFEISYRGGWYGGFDFHADSNGIFFAPPVHWLDLTDSFQYGLVPDSILQAINETVNGLRQDTVARSTEINCYDCDLVAVSTVVGGDSIRVLQAGEQIHPALQKLWPVLSFFVDSTRHKKSNGIIPLQTARMVAPPSPPPPPPLD